jgi:hypothetical protein
MQIYDLTISDAFLLLFLLLFDDFTGITEMSRLYWEIGPMQRNFETGSAFSLRVQGGTMFKFTAKASTVMAAAALVAGLAALCASIVPEARAAADVEGAIHQSLKGDRLPSFAGGAACSSQGWPHYEQICQFDLRTPTHEARAVRILALR